MIRNFCRNGTLVALAVASANSLAGGFAINEQSVSGMGMSFAGRSSSATDASTVFGNPAGMSHLEREQVSVGGAAIVVKSDIKDASGTYEGSNDDDMVPAAAVPMGYYVKPLNDQWSFGLGVYVPFALTTDYEHNFQGRYDGDRSEIRVITMQPTLSYRFNEQWSVGGGPTLNRIDGELSAAVPSLAGDGKIKVKGDDVALGYNIGVLYALNAGTRLGMTYHSKVEYKLRGDTTISGPAFGPFAGSTYNAALDLTTPESVDFSITHALTERWTVYAGSTWTRWSQFDELKVKNSGVPEFLVDNIGVLSEPQNWNDTWGHALGASYQINSQWVLRAGVAVDQSPTRNQYRSPRIPTGDRTIFSLGLGWVPLPDLSIDLAYSYLMEEDTDVASEDYRATYRNRAHGLGAQVNYSF